MELDRQNRIITDPKIMIGKPVIKGTRITVELILRQLAQGISVQELIENYPHLTKEDILAAIEYAAHTIQKETVYPFAAPSHAEEKTFA